MQITNFQDEILNLNFQIANLNYWLQNQIILVCICFILLEDFTVNLCISVSRIALFPIS